MIDSNNKVIYRPAELSDCEQIAELAHELNLFHDFDFKPDADNLKNDFRFIDAYVAERENEVLGYIQGYETYQAHDSKRGFEIQNLCIKKDTRSNGLGKSLMKNFIRKKYDAGIAEFKLTILKKNDTASNFYKSVGFELKDGNFIYFAKLNGENLQKFLSL